MAEAIAKIEDIIEDTGEGDRNMAQTGGNKTQADTAQAGCTIAQILEKMILHSGGNARDVNHFMKVWAYAKTIGELEHLDEETQFILEAAAAVHDIACPLCLEKYGNTNGEHQEKEGMPLVREFLQGSGIEESRIERIAWLVGHHHTYTGIDGMDYQILLEADYLVNADEMQDSREQIRNFRSRVFRTQAGIRLLESIFEI